MSDGVHLLVPFAGCSAAGCREAAPGLRLPHLERLLARLAPSGRVEEAEASLTMPHERVLARECGIDAPDGQIPWAAWQVAQADRDAGVHPWAWITPCHWRVGRDHIAMAHPGELQLDAQDSQVLLEAMRPYFEQDGLHLEYDAPTRWLAHGEVFRDLPTASLDRVAGRVVDPWLPRMGAARTLRRLQQEMQMLLYTHPHTDDRQARGLLPVNSFWVSGTGMLPPTHRAIPPQLKVANDLRDPALAGDAAGWVAAWNRLDATELARLVQALEVGREVRLTLCGEHMAQAWRGPAQGGWWRKLAGAFRTPSARLALEALE